MKKPIFCPEFTLFSPDFELLHSPLVSHLEMLETRKGTDISRLVKSIVMYLYIYIYSVVT